MRGYLHRLAEQFRRLRQSPETELSRWQRSVMFGVDLSRHCYRQLNEDRATQMAAALTYRTIFGLVPTFILLLLAFQAFGDTGKIKDQVLGFLERQFGTTMVAVESSPQAPTEAPAQGAEAPGSASGAGPAAAPQARSLQDVFDQFSAKAEQIDFTSIGVVGVLVLIYAAIALLVAIEQFFNQICRSPQGRPWPRRVVVYWSLITLGPLLLGVSLYFSSQLFTWVEHWGEQATAAGSAWGVVPAIGSAVRWLMSVAGVFTPLIGSWVLLFLVYMLMPNTRLRVRPVLIGSFVAAVLWELGKAAFREYVGFVRGGTFSAIYGSLGLIPLFLLLMYMTWYIVLFGLEIAYTLQTMRGKRFEEEADRAREQAVFNPQWLIPVVAAVGRGFREGVRVDRAELSERLRLPGEAVATIAGKLADEGLLHRLETGPDNEPAYALARPPESIALTDLVALGQRLAGQSERRAEPGATVLQRLGDAQVQAVSGKTLAGVLDEEAG